VVGERGAHEWFILKDDRPVGPVSADELALLAVGGHVGGGDLVWCEGLGEWVRLGRVLGVAEASAAPARATPQMHIAPSLTGLYLDRLPVKSGQRVPPAAPVAQAHSRPLPQPIEQRPQPARAVQRVASTDVPAPPPMSWQPAAAALVPVAPAMAAFSTSPPAEQEGHSGVRDAIANAIIAVMEKHGIRTVEDLAGNDGLEALARTVYDTLPWSIRTTIGLTVGRAPCEKRLVDLMAAARSRWLDPSTRHADLHQVVRDVVHSHRIEEWIAGAYRSVAGSVGGAASSLMSSVTRGLGGQTGADVGRGPPMLALEYAPAGGTIRR
jgi:hypothetical protein